MVFQDIQMRSFLTKQILRSMVVALQTDVVVPTDERTKLDLYGEKKPGQSSKEPYGKSLRNL